MKFESGPRVGDLTLTIRETGEVQIGTKIVRSKPIQVQFKDHRLDTDELHLSPEDKVLVEEALQDEWKFPEFNKTSDPRGYWVARESKRVGPKTEIPTKKCEAMVPDGEGFRPCDNPAIEGGNFCEDHVLEGVNA